ncbi:GNAT family N-acetyltransferase [Bacillus sp. CMF21]|uniref:GNAT family N-acetyltransferase n=1 Tax=Metabacillus dongyingensis TaxID=2874282 RepID=UPI001CBEBC05|nr:GNAT family N-acetyltransferase [Metabacillus dongyingensis]UAL50293.1 GNAT family N-acetyltransferase [Metabacillus dongyingensis]USK26543.1 GNAT family N-acetyltransferase [Bacillus sp. CMF21]
MSKQQMQIKLMVKKEYDLAAEFLRTDLELNALIIEDLTEEHMMVYGGYLNTHLNAILMIYPEKIYYYSPDINFPLGEFALIIRETGIRKIVGKKELVEEFKCHFQMDLESDSFMLRYEGSKDFQASKGVKMITSLEECRKLYDLFMNVDEYKMIGPNEDFFANDHFQNIESGKLNVFYKAVEGTMVSTAGVFIESSRTAIIVGVATPPVHRRKGYASEVIRAICQKLANEEKAIYLFYNNPDAGKLYKQLGFYEAAKWKVLGISAHS